MFSVLPPPTRYPSQQAYNLAVANGQAAPMLETNNQLKFPVGPEYQLLVGEGTYVLKDDLQLATPPPHPSETPILNPNPLATTPQPATAGTKLSLLSLNPRPAARFIYNNDVNASVRSDLQSSIQEHPYENRNSADLVPGSSDGGTSITGSAKLACSIGSAPAFGEGNTMLSTTSKDTAKRKKPKNSITKSNSSFISRCIVHESLTKRLQERQPDGYFAFANINRAFQWLDLSSLQKAEHLTKVLFTKGHALCHDINQTTKSTSHIDVIIGFSTGEIIWFEPISQRYTRLNKNGQINSSPVADIRWIPTSENLFLAAHMDGSLVVYDKEKDDTAFLPEENINGVHNNGRSESDGSTHYAARLHIEKSVQSKNQKLNPVSFWKLSNQRINAFAFSPDNRHLAVVSEDGTLRIIDFLKEELLDLYTSYYGGFLCVCWSPDAKYVLTGGQDDLVSIWSVADATIVARCQGHQSWVTAVCFDPWRCDEKNYRFGSVGEDCRLLLWDFSVGMLHRPKALSVRHRGSISSRFQNPLQRTETNASSSKLSAGEQSEDSIEHQVEPRATTAMLPPVMSKVIDSDPLCSLEFTDDSIITSGKTEFMIGASISSVEALLMCPVMEADAQRLTVFEHFADLCTGHIRTWTRPPNATYKDNLP